MQLRCFVLAVLVSALGQAQAPAYTAADLVNASDYSPGPFAPNSVLSIFGTNLSWYTQPYSSGQVAAQVPTNLSGVEVFVNNWPAPLLYVSPSQINFLIPSSAIAGTAAIHVVREGVTGPYVDVQLVSAAPALFDGSSGFAIATHADGTLLTDSSPAQPGEIVVVYVTGLGVTDPNPEAGEIPLSAAPLAAPGALNVALNGDALPFSSIEYAGLTPGCVGLYQLNIQLPQDVPSDPVIQVSMGTETSSGNPRIAVQ